MILRCIISYTTPDGRLFSAGELYAPYLELGMWLLAAADGQFKVEEAVPDESALTNPPADMAVAAAPVGGAPRSRTRAASDTAAGEAGGLAPAGRKR